MTAPNPTHAERVDHFASVIYQWWNPGLSWSHAHPDDQTSYRADAQAAIAAADTAAGVVYAPPTCRDVYHEVADRIALYTELESAQRAGVTAMPGRVRVWADALPTSSAEAAEGAPVQCWHTEAGTPCDSNECNQPERLAVGDYGDVPLDQTAETTTRVFAALHRSAEGTVTRVISLYEQWVKAGPPPLGASMARWWDGRLAELHAAIQPPASNDAAASPTKERP